MVRHYSYRMDHDTGFAPHMAWSICTLCGCKRPRRKHGRIYGNIESWAGRGSWVVGIGGKGTGKPDTLIYAMKVDDNYPVKKFRRKYPHQSSYLHRHGIKPTDHVLVSKRFYYFGSNAKKIPQSLQGIIHDRQGCKRIDEEVDKLEKFFAKRRVGKRGEPNNPEPRQARCGGCHGNDCH